jgi:hypothetical protein
MLFQGKFSITREHRFVLPNEYDLGSYNANHESIESVEAISSGCSNNGGRPFRQMAKTDECAVVVGGSENKNQERRVVAHGLPPVAPLGLLLGFMPNGLF